MRCQALPLAPHSGDTRTVERLPFGSSNAT
jgi:hypothetical protein